MSSANFKTFFCTLIIIFGAASVIASDESSESVPAAEECTTFDLTTSGSSSSWRWSAQNPPPYVPINSGNFLWSDVEGSTWESDVYYNVSAATVFTFQYFGMFPDDDIYVTTKLYPSGELYDLTWTAIVDANWRSFAFTCGDCCWEAEETFCDIQLVITARGTYNDEMAIDNIGRDNACGESQCYEFDSDVTSNSEWESSTWENSEEEPPNLSQYPSFDTTEIDPYYTYIQDRSGSTKSPSTFYIPNDNTKITFYYFFDSPFADAANSFSLQFHNIVDLNSPITLHTVVAPYSSWVRVQITCDAKHNYCCGGADKIPCAGQIEIVANVDETYQQALLAIDSIGTTCDSTPPTVPPPSPFCCSFDSSECGSIGLGDWSWSAQKPATNISNSSGYYEWTKSSYAIWETDLLSGVSDQTLFTFQYYIESPTSQIRISFAEVNGEYTSDVTTVSFSSKEWHTFSFYCVSCCQETQSCSGQLFLSAIIFDGTQVAIDNVGRDSVCNGLFSCCLFDDASICNFAYEAASGYQWQFSGTVLPTFDVPSPGSEFVYFETLTYTDPSPISVGLRSDFLTIDSDTVFRGNVYVFNPYSASFNNALKVTFNNTGTGQITQLSPSVTSTDLEWQILYFYCDSIYGNCCQGASSCTGYIYFEAVVDAYGGQVVYAIDAFEVEGTCSSFPGLKSESAIKFSTL